MDHAASAANEVAEGMGKRHAATVQRDRISPSLKKLRARSMRHIDFLFRHRSRSQA